MHQKVQLAAFYGDQLQSHWSMQRTITMTSNAPPKVCSSSNETQTWDGQPTACTQDRSFGKPISVRATTTPMPTILAVPGTIQLETQLPMENSSLLATLAWFSATTYKLALCSGNMTLQPT